MRLHTSLSDGEVHAAMTAARASGLMPSQVQLNAMLFGSRKRDRAFEVRLYVPRWLKPATESRRWTNSGQRGAGGDYAATWSEWGYFMAEVYARDPRAVFGGAYADVNEFIERTGDRFAIPVQEVGA